MNHLNKNNARINIMNFSGNTDNNTLQALIDLARNDLTRPRFLTTRLESRIAIHQKTLNALDGLTHPRLQQLEPFEQELLLASLFTPVQKDRENYESVLDNDGIREERLDILIKALVAENLSCLIRSSAGSSTVFIPEVILERAVRLLHLTESIHSEVADHLENVVTPLTRSSCRSLARQPLWRKPSSRAILIAFLKQTLDLKSFHPDKLSFLSQFVRSYRPKTIHQLAQQLHHLISAYEEEQLPAVFNERLKKSQLVTIRAQSCNETIQKHRLDMSRAILKDFDQAGV